VALAVWGMARSLTPDRARATFAIVAALVMLTSPSLGLSAAVAQIGIIVVAGVLGWRLLQVATNERAEQVEVPIGRSVAVAAWVLFVALLIGLPLLRQLSSDQALAVFDSFFRVGSFVFGGGHVVLPLLQAEVVPTGWVTNEQFLAGYGAAQAVPGPLFTFTAYLGAVMSSTPNGIWGATLALVAVYVPSFLLLIGTLPWWGVLRSRPAVQGALRGVNAAVVGLLVAALYQSVWTAAILSPLDFALGLVGFGLLALWGVPPWLVVLVSAAGGALLARLAG
jgi:chromate transporter